jgi:acetate kinase
MKKRILVFNVGSSSIRYGLFENKERIYSGIFERLKNKEDFKKAFKKVFHKLQRQTINVIAHRIVHGGDIKQASEITSEIKNKIKEFSTFAPLHNPNELLIINLSEKFKIPQYAVFDTSFYSNLPKVAKIYAIPSRISKKYNLQKYGFHGISHKYASENMRGKTISCHLGQGASITAIKDKRVMDTSMGLTPNEGVVMMTRSGSIAPELILFLEKKGYNVENILNSESGLKGISGFSDFRDILKTINKKESKLAYDIFVYHITEFIGSYIAILNGLDNLIFTGAIGENCSKLRKDICKNFNFIGLKLNEEKNKNPNSEKIISSANSKIKVFVIKTDEEKVIAEEVLKLI